jgi:hypothetical protein
LRRPRTPRGKSWNDAITILARYILRREHRFDARILSLKRSQIAKLKSCPIVWKPDHPYRQRSRWHLIRAKKQAADWIIKNFKLPRPQILPPK